MSTATAVRVSSTRVWQSPCPYPKATTRQPTVPHECGEVLGDVGSSRGHASCIYSQDSKRQISQGYGLFTAIGSRWGNLNSLPTCFSPPTIVHFSRNPADSISAPAPNCAAIGLGCVTNNWPGTYYLVTRSYLLSPRDSFSYVLTL